MKRTYYSSLSVLKALACIGVIWMHCGFPGITGKIVSYLFKFNVPIFFMISGFFLYSENKDIIREKLKNRIPHIFKLLLFAFLFYGLFSIFKACIIGDMSIGQWFNEAFVNYNFFIKIFLGTFFCGPMWFLYAQLWAYILLYILLAKFKIDKMYILIPLLLIVHIVVRFIIRKYDFQWYSATYFRTFYLYALPFILLGCYIGKNKEQIQNKYSNRILIVIAVISCMLQFVEYALMRESLDFYFSTIFYSLSLFILAVKNTDIGKGTSVEFLGKQLSMPVYIVHIFIIEILGNVMIVLNLPKVLLLIFSWLYPVLSVVFSILIGWLYYIVFNKNK